MMHSILATLLICLGMSNSGMPISNYIEENQELKLSQTEAQPKLESTTTTNTITLNSWDYTAYYYGEHLYHQTWQSKASFSNNAFSIIANEITTQTWYVEDASGYGQMYVGNKGTDGSLGMGYNDTKYNNNNILLMLEITPYNINIDTRINVHIQCKIPVQSVDYALVETYSTEDDLSSLFNTQITNDKGQTILSEIYNINNGYTYNQTNDIKTFLYNSTTGYEEGNWIIPISITPNKTNYRLINIYPLKGVNGHVEPNVVSGVYGAIAENKTYLVNDQFTITNTNIIPTGTYEVVDIPGVMFYILTMPFTFVSQAFNLTLFVGTPYQINISNLFLAILAMLIFIWIIKLIVQKGG